MENQCNCPNCHPKPKKYAEAPPILCQTIAMAVTTTYVVELPNHVKTLETSRGVLNRISKFVTDPKLLEHTQFILDFISEKSQGKIYESSHCRTCCCTIDLSIFLSNIDTLSKEFNNAFSYIMESFDIGDCHKIR